MTGLLAAFSSGRPPASLEMGTSTFAPVLDHLARLTDDVGVFEHAIGLTPRRSIGYTTDDVARALVVAVRWPRADPAPTRVDGRRLPGISSRRHNLVGDY